MLLINLIRALMLLAAIGLWHIYHKDFLTVSQGLVIVTISFFGMTLLEIIEEKVVEAFNQKSPKT
jgi:hypothetical protein